MDSLPTFDAVKIMCKSSDCENGRHCYRPRRGQWKAGGTRGECQSCGDRSVDVALVRAFRTAPPEAILDQLELERIRHAFMAAPIDEEGARQLRRIGVDGVRARARRQLVQRIGFAANDWDGRQTPKAGSVLNLAQHATATCCRKCLYYWYDIPRERNLEPEELDFCAAIVLAQLDRREEELLAIAASDPPAVSRG